MKVQAYSYELLADFISGIEKVGHWEKGNSKLRSADIKKVMEIESQYFNPLTSLPNIGMVAREAGMSLSKFKKCFKEIYGTPPYVYHLNQKLEVQAISA
ncbi:MAG: hypothetical protein R2822_30545 [Spirosomataceae bacterium]